MPSPSKLPWETVYVSGFGDDDRYDACCARARAIGATHTEVGQLPVKPRHEKTDPTDPYLEYSFILGCLFRFVVPDEVRAMTPPEYEAQAMAALKRRCESLRRHGLKGRMWLLDPHALPEAVFAEHPAWRGPRVDYPPRTKRPYFAPCIDHPEVLALYRKAVAELCRECPEIDTFRLTINDSGAGVCWSRDLYSGTNGPAACEQRTMGERLRDFFQAWLDGAADAGVTARVLSSPRGLSPAQAAEARHLSPPNSCVLPLPGGFPGASAGASGPRPTCGIADPVAFLDSLAVCADKADVQLSVTNELDWRLLERFVAQPVTGYAAKAAWLEAFAAELAGMEGAATELVNTWLKVRGALQRVGNLPWAGLLFEHGVLSKRWLNRPLVCFPDELRPDELDWWRPFLFEAGGHREVHNLLNVHAIQVVDGLSHGMAIQATCQAAVGELKAAAATYDSLADCPLGDEFRLQAARLRALGHCFRTIGNTVLWQLRVDAFTADPPAPRLHHRERDDVTAIYRDEIANATELAELLETAPGPVFIQADSPAGEDTYILSPELPAQLRRKAAVMAARWRDLERLMPYPLQFPER